MGTMICIFLQTSLLPSGTVTSILLSISSTAVKVILSLPCDKIYDLPCLFSLQLAGLADWSCRNKSNVMITFSGLGNLYRWVSLIGHRPRNFIHVELKPVVQNLKSLPQPGSCENDPGLSYFVRKERELPKINYQSYN